MGGPVVRGSTLLVLIYREIGTSHGEHAHRETRRRHPVVDPSHATVLDENGLAAGCAESVVEPVNPSRRLTCEAEQFLLFRRGCTEQGTTSENQWMPVEEQ